MPIKTERVSSDQPPNPIEKVVEADASFETRNDLVEKVISDLRGNDSDSPEVLERAAKMSAALNQDVQKPAIVEPRIDFGKIMATLGRRTRRKESQFLVARLDMNREMQGPESDRAMGLRVETWTERVTQASDSAFNALEAFRSDGETAALDVALQQFKTTAQQLRTEIRMDQQQLLRFGTALEGYEAPKESAAEARATYRMLTSEHVGQSTVWAELESKARKIARDQMKCDPRLEQELEQLRALEAIAELHREESHLALKVKGRSFLVYCEHELVRTARKVVGNHPAAVEFAQTKNMPATVDRFEKGYAKAVDNLKNGENRIDNAMAELQSALDAFNDMARASELITPIGTAGKSGRRLAEYVNPVADDVYERAKDKRAAVVQQIDSFVDAFADRSGLSGSTPKPE